MRSASSSACSGGSTCSSIVPSSRTALKRVAKYVHLTPGSRALLEEETQREQSDIAPERHRQNVVDLFGEGLDPTAYHPEGATEPAGATTTWRRESPATSTAPRSVESGGGTTYLVDPETGVLLDEEGHVRPNLMQEEEDDPDRPLFEN
mgnify:CR=1 FL=1